MCAVNHVTSVGEIQYRSLFSVRGDALLFMAQGKDIRMLDLGLTLYSQIYSGFSQVWTFTTVGQLGSIRDWNTLKIVISNYLGFVMFLGSKIPLDQKDVRWKYIDWSFVRWITFFFSEYSHCVWPGRWHGLLEHRSGSLQDISKWRHDAVYRSQRRSDFLLE